MTTEKVSAAARRTAHSLFRVAGVKDGRRLADIDPQEMMRLVDGLTGVTGYALELGQFRDAAYLRLLARWVRRQADRAWEARFVCCPPRRAA